MKMTKLSVYEQVDGVVTDLALLVTNAFIWSCCIENEFKTTARHQNSTAI